MKSYKEINEEISVHEALKEKTKRKMVKKTVFPYQKSIIAAACCLLAVVSICLLNGKSKDIIIQEVADTSMMKEKELQSNMSKEVMVPAAKTKGIDSFSSDDLVFIDMDENTVQKYQEEFPALSDFEIPRMMTSTHISYQEITSNDKDYPYIVYTIRNETADQAAYIQVIVQNEKTAKLEEKDFYNSEDYHGYQLLAYTKAGSSLYWVNARKSPYIFEVNADGISQTEFKDFVKSFFAK